MPNIISQYRNLYSPSCNHPAQIHTHDPSPTLTLLLVYIPTHQFITLISPLIYLSIYLPTYLPGASLATVGNNNDTLFHLAAFNGQFKVIRWLVKMGAKDVAKMMDSKQRTVMHVAVSN